jgi:hypothetical protein
MASLSRVKISEGYISNGQNICNSITIRTNLGKPEILCYKRVKAKQIGRFFLEIGLFWEAVASNNQNNELVFLYDP